MNSREFHKMINQEFTLSGKNLEETEAFRDYWVNSGNYGKLDEKSQKIISSYYADKIEENKEDISRYIDSDKVEQIITPVSFSYMKKSEIDELPIQKSLKVFPNIKTIILLYTDDTEKHGLNLKKTLADEYRVEIFLEKIAETETSLSELQKKYGFAKGKTVIDITLGLKITSIQLYKLAVETDIDVINWVEPYKPVIHVENEEIEFDRERTFRVSLKTSLERMMQPAIESMKKKKKLNEDLKRWNFKEVANYYSTSGNEMFEKVFGHLAQIINFNSVFTFDFDKMKRRSKVLVDDLVDMELASTTKEREDNDKLNPWIHDLIFVFSIVSKSSDEIEELQNLSEELDEAELCDEELDVEENGDRDTRISGAKRLLGYIFDSNGDWDPEIGFGENILKWLLIELVKRNLDDGVKLNVDMLNPKLAGEISNKYDPEFREHVLDVFDTMTESAMQKIDDYTITLNRGVLSIPKFNKKIDLCKYDEFKEYFNKDRKPKKLYMKALENLIIETKEDSFSYFIDLEDIFGEGKKDTTLAKDKTKFGNEIATPLNAIVSKIIPKKGEKEDLIILKTDGIAFNKYYYTYK